MAHQREFIQSGSRSDGNPTSVWLVFIGLVLAWNVPNFLPWERSQYPETYWIDMQERLLKCLLLAALWVSLFTRPWVAWLTSWVIGLWWLPVAVAVRYVNESPVTVSLVGIAMASSPGEVKNLLLSLPFSMVLAMLVWNGLGVAIVIGLKGRSMWQWNGRTRVWIFLISALLLLMPFILNGRSMGNAPSKVDESAAIDPFLQGDQAIGSDAELPRAFPYELPWAMAQYWKARSVVNAAIARMSEAPLAHGGLAEDAAPDALVLVIGESASRKAWSLFHPLEVETTPKIQARLRRGEFLFPFSQVVAQSISTRQVVPSMLTPQPLLWPDGTPNPDAKRSVISFAAQAGYRTAWFSNQAAVGQFDGVIAAYANEAQNRAFLNPSSFFSRGSYDEVLLPALSRFLHDKGKAFVVLHTLGSHFRFEHRYPKGFGSFPNPQSEKESYYNSIAYTDMVINRVIEILEEKGHSAVLLYVSDHGQGLADKNCRKSETNRLTVDAYEVPALVWLSQKYAQRNPLVVSALEDNNNYSYTTAMVHQTLRDFIAGLGGMEEGPSLLRKPHADIKQSVVSPGGAWIDFQDAVARNPCFIKAP